MSLSNPVVLHPTTCPIIYWSWSWAFQHCPSQALDFEQCVEFSIRHSRSSQQYCASWRSVLERFPREEWHKLPVWRVLGTRLLTVIHAIITITFPRPQPSLLIIILETRGHRACVRLTFLARGATQMSLSTLLTGLASITPAYLRQSRHHPIRE